MELVYAFRADQELMLGLTMVYLQYGFRQGVILLFILIFLGGCVSLKAPVEQEGRIALTSDQLHLLNGEYEILSDGNSHIMLDYCLLGKQKFDLINRPGLTDRIRIEAISKDRLKVTMLHGQEAAKHKKIKGKLVGGYYVFKTNQLLPLIAINIYGHQEVRLGLNAERSLTVQFAGTTVVFVVVVPVTGGKNEEDHLVFKRR